jgi:class 3 adenylate cyclase
MRGMAEERRLVTVLFADVTSSTALGESIDPEALRGLLGRFFNTAREIVQSHGGTVEKFIGDAVMAVFGLPQAHGDDAARAIAAALELRDRVRDDPGLGDRLPIRLGINTGEVVASRQPESPGDFLVTGDAVNVAARLQQTAEPWTIIAGERTVRAAGDGFEFGPPMRQEARGKSVEVQAAVVLGRSQTHLRRRLPLVGRDGDLAQLRLAAQRAVGERRPFLVTLLAPAGTGKTRLLEEFLDVRDGLAGDARVAIAQCLPYGQRLTYWPLRSLLQGLADLPDDMPPERLRPAIQAWLNALGDDSAEHSAELLAATLGATDSDVADQSAIFSAWRRSIELAAAREPLILVIEDLHWSSNSLLDLIEYVLQPHGELPLLMIALARPELVDRRPGWGGGRRNYLSLALDPLDDPAVEKLVANLLDGPSPDIVRGVVARADGNPFYAGEIVRSIIERVPDLSDPVAVRNALAALPDTVQATVLARLDVLPVPARRLLQVGSIFGRSFRRAGVLSLEPGLEADADPSLEALVDRDLLRPAASDAFTFRHILIREVANSTLTRTERATLHASAAGWLEAETAEPDAIAELIAYHYREAVTLRQEIGLPVEPELKARAVEWLTRAAELAGAAAANLEASRHLRAAIELAERDDLPELYVRLGGAYGGGDEGAAAYAEAYRLGVQLGRGPDFLLQALSSELATVMRWHASIAHQRTEPEIAALRSRAAELLEKASDERSRAMYYISEGFYPFWLSNSVRVPTDDEKASSGEHARLGLEMAERLDDASMMSAALDSLTSSFGFEDVNVILDLSSRRVAMGDRITLTERMDAHHMVAWANCLLGEFAEAARLSRSGTALVLPGQSSNFTLAVAVWLPYSLAQLGQWDDVIPAAERAMTYWSEADTPAPGFGLHGLYSALWVARARHNRDQVDRWSELVERIALRFEENNPTHALIALARMDLAGLVAIVANWNRYSMRLQHLDRALGTCVDYGQRVSLEALDSIVEIANRGGLRPLEAQARRARGVQEAREDDLRASLRLFEEMASVPHIGRVEIELGQLVGDQTLVASGLARLESLGDLDQLDRVRKSGVAVPEA